jgi:hemolysin III
MNNNQSTLNKPILRGHFHQGAFFFSLGLVLMFLKNVYNEDRFNSSLIYSISLITLFGVSALYHRPTWGTIKRQWMRRLDHAAIYFLIAGTGTAISFKALSGKNYSEFIILIWIAAFFGILQSMFWITAPKWIQSIFYVVMGLLVLPYFPSLKLGLGPTSAILIGVGGAIYILGAIVYALKKPNPIPKYFGHHEIFHLLVILGAMIHFWVITN